MRVRWGDQVAEVTTVGAAAEEAVAFVCAEMERAPAEARPTRTLAVSGEAPPIVLAERLMADLTQALLWDNAAGVAIHCALLELGGAMVLMPGASGQGKSTLAVFAALSGHRLHTDELVLFSPRGLEPLYRPAHLKPGSAFVLDRFAGVHAWRSPELGCLVPVSRGRPSQVTHVVVPHYRAGSPVSLEPLTPGTATLAVAGAWVNARNLEGAGLDRCAALAAGGGARLVYSDLDDALRALVDFTHLR